MGETILSVKFFRTAAGKEPVREFLRALSPTDRKIIGTDIKEVQLSWPLGMPLVKKMEYGLWEIRSRLECRISRILFTIEEGKMVLLHAFIKKSVKTPKPELETARTRKAALGGLHD